MSFKKTGDIKGNTESLIRNLKTINYPSQTSYKILTSGNPGIYLPIIHYSLFNYSPVVAKFLSDKHYDMFAKNDLDFINTAFHCLITLFNYKPELTTEQFFSNKFAEGKIILCKEIIDLVIQKNNQLISNNKKRKGNNKYNKNNNNNNVSPKFHELNNSKNNSSHKKISSTKLASINNTNNPNKYSLSNNINENSSNFQDNPINLQSYSNGIQPNLNFDNDTNSENIKVCLRIRPMSLQEQSRNDVSCIEPVSNEQLILKHKNLRRSYTFNLVFGQDSSQEDVFFNCSMDKLIDSALDGYSVTIFAYGQTGSGKTYTIMGRDDAINEKILKNNKYSGIMPKSINYIWSAVSRLQQKFYIKVSFLEIYNEQINDLLNPTNNNLQIRWDQKQGFFVEGLLVIECKKPEDIVEIILQGTKNRKKGSHDLNKDSSRSHSILTVYLISEFQSGSETYKKYGKISFVDLAGSERLKETHSKGGMLKETGNINKSLFVLGKVISSLTDKKNTNQHIPYRDSKLTMLLMDSIGGTAKTLMIACVSPSSQYSDETMSTLNYASRTMNIKNKPLVQMDAREKAREDLQEENEIYLEENEFLKAEFMKLLGMVPKMANGGLTVEDIENYKISQGFRSNEELDKEIEKLKIENEDLKNIRETQMKENRRLNEENNLLNNKLINLENVFIGGDLINKQDSSMSNISEKNYNISAIMVENTELKKTIDKLETDKIQLQEMIAKGKNPGVKIFNDSEEFENMKEQNSKLVRRVEFLQKRERELLETIMKIKMEINI